jgi:N-acetylglucosaminyl-diphospho-decaprenol L-rhamnosyltransferase
VDITAILVCWEDRGDLLPAVESLAAARQRLDPPLASARLAVVFNGKPGFATREVLASWPDAILLENAGNRGFGPAVNQAAAAAGGDVFLLVNPDARAEGDLFGAVARGLLEHPEAAALAPRLLDAGENGATGPRRRLAPPGREDQFTFQLRRLPTLAGDARELLLVDHLLPDNAARRAARYAGDDRGRPFPVEQAAAAALAIRADAFRRVGGFDERFVPAWYEDVDLCRRLAAVGPILYWPAAALRHRGGAAADRLGYDRFLPIFYENALRYRRISYPIAARAAYRLLLAAGMALRLVALPLRRNLPRPRGQAARAYLAVLRRALGVRPPPAFGLPPPDSGPA